MEFLISRKSFLKIIVPLVMLIINLPIFSQWEIQPTEQSTPLTSVSAADNNVVWTCGYEGRVLKTSNGGLSWILTNSPNDNVALFNIWAVDELTALVAGQINLDAFVYKTTDGGNIWTLVFSEESSFINSILQFSNDNNDLFMQGDPVGGRWSLWKSSDKGSTWDSTGNYLPQFDNEAAYKNSMFIVYDSNSYSLWFGTNDTTIIHYSNFVWTRQHTGVIQNLCIWFNDDQKGMAGGEKMVYSTNGGNVWTQINSIPGFIFALTGEGNNWWCTRSDKIYYSSNNGSSWTLQFTLGHGFFIHLTKSRTGSGMWAVSFNSEIVHSLGIIGIKPVSNLVPEGFNLYQNYPNPFNPSTLIKFAVAKATNVKLVLLDVSGREIETLVNENVNPGIYEVSWDASKYSSGIYFYRLLTNEYTSVKKMALIK